MAKPVKKSVKATKTSKTPVVAASVGTAKTRKLKAPRYQSFKLQKRIKPEGRLPGSFRLLRSAIGTFKRNWKVFLGIVAVYGVLTLVLVQGLGSFSGLQASKDSLDQALHGSLGQLASGVTLFVSLVGTSGSTLSSAAGSIQFILVLIVSLALIWTLREVYAGRKVAVRDGYYRGMYPLIPFILVLVVIGLQLIPFAVGGILYTTVTSNGIAATGVEHVLWALVFFLLALTTLYMLCSSIFALYIVCLPNMTPMGALRSARQLVAGRRWTILRKILFMPLGLLVLAGLIMVPLILFATPVATWLFFALSVVLLSVAHSYLYALYRSLL